MLKFIENIGDYFATNYFDEDFAKKVFEKSGYATEDIKIFNKLISPLKDKYYRYKNEYITLKRAKDRIKLTNQFHTEVLNALKYDGNVNDYDDLCILNDNEGIPVRSKLYRGDKPHLFIMEMQSIIQEGDQPAAGLFDQVYYREQWEYVFKITDPELKLSPSVINEALSELFLIEPERRPQYVLMMAGSEIYLIHYERWFRGSYLRFSLEDLFDETSIKRDYYALFYFLLSKEALAPDSDIVLMDQLDEDSHKSAYAVTQDLKEGVIKAIEDLANESVYYLKWQDRLNTLDEQFAGKLKDDCLTLVYRLLFLFYAEARPELEILPISDDVYEKGYSLEMLRDLEQVPLQSETAKNGYFFHDSLWHLFMLVGHGYNEGDTNTKSFIVKHIDSPLFDDQRLHVLQGIRFRNFIWQEIIQYLSLSKKQRGRARGRISYANLGINQLGSVYEGLLSYRGYFAHEDQIEVKKADDPTGKEGTYVVPRSRRGDFEEAEILKDPENPEQDKIIPAGSFIYRLSGRDRQKSASYYTPEVLTHTTVKYTLKPILERLEKGEIKADDLLKLKILEPAMGAAAFHNEVINQIAEAYLNWKQKEKRDKVPPNAFKEELQRVKAYIATHNVYGVDINPTAVELGKISLWLNVIHKDMATPFFGYRLGVGNAVVGAWRKVYSKEKVIIKYTNQNRTSWERREWWEITPRQIPWSGKGSTRKENEVYHFLLPDKNMVSSVNIRMLKEEYPDQERNVNEWKKDFIRPLTSDEFVTMQKISEQIDQLFNEHYEQQKEINETTQSRITVWGQQESLSEILDYRKKERLAELRDEVNAPYYKLKMIMDYWCSLWFWDMRQAEHLPTREEYISDLLNILDFDLEKALQEDKAKSEKVDVFAPIVEQAAMPFIDNGQQRLKVYKSSDEKQQVGEVIARYAKQSGMFPDQRKQLIQQYAKEYGFFHYELEFVEVFNDRGGFNVIVGNPPWVKIIFEEGDIIAEKYPEILIRNFTAPQIREYANTILEDKYLLDIYQSASIESENQAIFSNAIQNFPLLIGQQGNLYKLVLTVAFQIVSKSGFIGILHPETVYDDPNGKVLRKDIYNQLLYHFHFLNELLLFAEIGHRMLFSVNIYKGKSSDIDFISINNLFHPSTIDGTFIHDGFGVCGGFKIKDEGKGKFVWNTKPHKDRIIHYTEMQLKLLSEVFEDGENFKSVKLVNIQSSKIIQVIEKISSFPFKINNYDNIIVEGWHETNDVNNGFIQRKTCLPEIENYEMIYSGPHTHVANPLSKTPRSICTEKAHYDVIDLTLTDENYIQRTNYLPNIEISDYIKAIKGFIIKYNEQGKHIHDNWIEYYKLSFSKMLNTSSERTLQPAIIPQKTAHINGIITITFKDPKHLLELSAISSSVVFDFLVKTIGTANLTNSRLSTLPLGIDEKFHNHLFVRTLRLNCLNKYYKKLWQKNYDQNFKVDNWSIEDGRLDSFEKLSREWTWTTAIRNLFARRWALIEIDVITSLAMGLTLDELLSIYNVTFALMQQYEDETFYDQKGNIVFTVNRSLTGVGLDRRKWDAVKNNKEGEFVKHTIEYELHSGTEIIYCPPFDKCDRVEDYKQAWAHFEKVFAGK
jgi:hypothetical protein